jgi:hypothetical protein
MGFVAAANDSSRFACYHLIDDYHAPSRLGTAMRVWQIATLRGSICARLFTAALTITVLLATSCQSQAAEPEPKRIMMLHSFGPRFKPWSDYEQYSLGD